MRKIIILAAMMLLGAFTALWAVPAIQTKYTYTQPDGSVIVLQNHGDEYYHWTTNEAGTIVELGEDGFWHPANVSTQAHKARMQKANIARKRTWSSYENPFPTNKGKHKVLCILAAWSDLDFSVDNPNAHFSSMLNEEGYSYNGAVGSVRDYFLDNSLGQYEPVFDVFGPVKLSKTMAYYSGNGVLEEYRVYEAIMEAYALLAGQINIDDYDTDNDGNVDMVLFYYPGTNPAEGGEPMNIWPHQRTDDFGMLGTKGFNRYFCTSELRNDDGVVSLCPIGTTCHEFAHSLGLPDFYDTDYGESGGHNEFTTAYYDLMGGGNYNEKGNRPPYLSAVERNMLGWMPNMSEIGAGDYVLGPVQENHGYISRAKNGGEYFVLECRNGGKWDAYFANYHHQGLFVYHVDKSSAYNVSGDSAHLTGAELWETNCINAYYGHPCYYIITSGTKPDTGEEYHFFPFREINEVALTDWGGNQTGVTLKDIAFDGTNVSFTSVFTGNRDVNGYVYDASGNPILGAQVVLSRSSHPFNAAPALLSEDILGTTNGEGYYEITLPEGTTSSQIITVRKDGYVPVSMNVPVKGLHFSQDFYLSLLGQGSFETLQYYDPDAKQYIAGGLANFAAGIWFTPEDLEAKGLVGGRLESITVKCYAENYSKMYLFASVDGSFQQVWPINYTAGNMMTYDIGRTGFTIPEGKSLQIGYILLDVTDEFSIIFTGPFDTMYAGCILDIDNESDGWESLKIEGNYYTPIVGATVSKKEDITFSMLGFAGIVLRDGVPAAVAPADKTLYRVEWTLDGVAVEAPVAIDTLAAGSHTYMAQLFYYDGTSERVYYEFDN